MKRLKLSMKRAVLVTLSFPLRILLVIVVLGTVAMEQSTNATVSGIVLDPSGSAIPAATLQLVNDVTGLRYAGLTNNEGIYAFSNLPPGPYRIQVSKIGFKTLIKPDIILNVQDALAINFTLPVGALSETVTVEGGAPLVNTESATVSTVVDRQFAENLPLNGRSFQTLIQLTPGVVATASNNADNGQFSVNGQRSASNYWMVDGVSANFGISTTNQVGNGLAGAMPSLSVLGGTNSLVSTDALQEFRIQTSTYAPEFGRAPGGQISIVTRSGTNRWHGNAFDYLRNDVFDANDWFANHNGLPKPEERQNDFGGTFSGPILKDRTFFFFSYEGLRLRLPQVVQSLVPDLAARQNAVPAMQPYLNAYPLPNHGAPDNVANGIARFDASFSNSASLDAYSLRLDHKASDKLSLFGRYNYSPSHLSQRGSLNNLSDVFPSNATTETATIGGTWTISPLTVNDLRVNYSRMTGQTYSYLDTFGGAVPLPSLPFPDSFTSRNAAFTLITFSLGLARVTAGPQGDNKQRQFNIVDNLSIQAGSHNLKFGADFRRLSPSYGNPIYQQLAYFLDVPSAQTGNLLAAFTISTRDATLLFRNIGLFGQDTWRVTPRLTLTYGVRWDLDVAPSSNPPFTAVTGFHLNDLSNLALAPLGTPAFKTTYANFAPRFGAAYLLSPAQNWQTVLRTGFGMFYDLASSEAGNLTYYFYYPYGTFNTVSSSTFPLSPAAAAPPPITASNLASAGGYAFDPNLKLPYNLQWSVALEQGLGPKQTITASYIGSVGRRLMQTEQEKTPNANFAQATIVTNAATSDYDALQVQFQRRLSSGLQALASWTWSHSIDTGSAGSLFGNTANAFLPGVANPNRGPSDFDIRNSLSAGITYDIPMPKVGRFVQMVSRGWSLETLVMAHSSAPVEVYDGAFFTLKNAYAQVRPDLVAGTPLYIYGTQYPGGKAFNPAAFAEPPIDSNGDPVRQGTLGRNALRGFPAVQWDFSIHRDFAVRESMKLQFRAEMFNLLNHPNFAPPVGDISNSSQFGLSTSTLANYLAGGNVGAGGFSPLYQIGGPRSVQLALKLSF